MVIIQGFCDFFMRTPDRCRLPGDNALDIRHHEIFGIVT